MIDPRIYRAGLVLIALALIVFGFSFRPQAGALGENLAPSAWSGPSAAAQTSALARLAPDRSPGSTGDLRLAAEVRRSFEADGGLGVSEITSSEQTTAGARAVPTVIANRTGLTPGAIVVVADRDMPGRAGLSGTVVLLELAQALDSDNVSRTVTLVSTSGTAGAAGARAVASELARSGQPLDAVITLGDLAAARATQPIVQSFSNTMTLAPPQLTATLAHYMSQTTGIADEPPGFASQLVQLAVPVALGPQSPFAKLGAPAVSLSLSGARAAGRSSERIAPNRPMGIYQALIDTINALQTAPSVPAPAAFLVLSGKAVPLWAVRLLVLALILAPALTTLDALARVRRRGHPILRLLEWSLLSSMPFLIAVIVLRLARLSDILTAAPTGPTASPGPAGLPLTTSGALVLGGVGVLFLGSCLALAPLGGRLRANALGRPRADARRSGAGGSDADAAAVALNLALCAVALIVWILNPFAALLLVPALHLWLWLAREEVRASRLRALLLAVLGATPIVLVAVYYGNSLGLSPAGLLWSTSLYVAGGGASALSCLLWCLVLGFLANALILALRSSGSLEAVPAPAPVTLRGPSGYAGPGSLGGTESALRR
jgi:hypothetical protein